MYRKHVLRHEKPFLCDVDGCPKSKNGEGFTTPNDLDRHRRTKHKIFPSEAKVLYCPLQSDLKIDLIARSIFARLPIAWKGVDPGRVSTTLSNMSNVCTGTRI